ncbi:cytosolic carboxypeptidase 2 isoform X1 [Peromyscus californicus insignis]|uniref:cytosolic carboxypeptidase 2 isoform X1 n=1 Tax=Peromyscus californicus insignis TaxID=564181 RepID=UPI0022A76B9B|nr:cytosolic carboxypeptidase 2 isoform X1 [Peromyscus californicus insignis]
MFPALETELKPETLSDPYEDFMHHHLQYYGYFKAQKGNLSSSATHQCVWKTSPRYTLNGSYGERDNLISDTLEKESFLYPLMLSSPLLRSRQLLYDELDEVNPRLREPRELFSFFSSRGPLQSPKWPIECEVIKENIHHIEWVPPEPEYFYQPTGDEKVPEIVGEEQGTVVYQLDSVPTEGAYFTSSRIGGKRGIIKELAVTLQGPEDNTLLFESRFESGNLQKAVRVGVYEYELTLRTDLYTDKHTQWFYFRVQNTRKEVTYRFTIVNLLKPKSLYAVGMKPLMYSQLDATTYNIGWRREGHEIKYYKNNMDDGQQPLYCLTWTIQFPHDQDTCFFAHFYPYTYTDLQCYLLSIANNPIQSQFCKLRALCRSLAGNTVYLLTVTNPSRTPQEAAAKKAVVLSARVHPGESNGSWIMRGFLDFILSNSPDAQLLRDIFVFKVIPMLNPDGVIVGNYRCSLAGRDLNRHYKTVLKDSFPCIWYTKNMIKRLLEEREVLLYCDFHGHSRKNNVFLYGCNSNSRKHWLHERVFPLMLSKNAPDKFSFDSCNFKVQKCKEGTGRVVMWRMGVINSYTIESTFGGSTLGSKRDTHFTIEDLKSLGYHVCDTILDFCDPDQTKYTQCLQELKELLQQEIHKKFSNFGQDMDLEASWSDIPLSDIESSTSGSDSSLSDGLPAHLLNIANELNQKMLLKKTKKKRLQTRKQRNEQYQKNYLMRELKLAEDTPGRARFASTLQKQPTLLKAPEKSSSSVMRNEKPRLNETQLSGREKGTSLDPPLTSLVLPKNKETIQTQLSGRDKGTSLEPPLTSLVLPKNKETIQTQLSGRDKGTSLEPPLISLVLPKNKETIQSKKPGFTASCSPKRSTNSGLGPAPDVKANWPRTRYPATRKDRSAVAAVYPSLHIYTYP